MHLKQPRFTYRASRLFIKNKDEAFKRTASDKVLRDKAFYIAKNQKYDEYQVGFSSMIHKFFYKKSTTYKGTGINSDSF